MPLAFAGGDATEAGSKHFSKKSDAALQTGAQGMAYYDDRDIRQQQSTPCDI